MSSTNRDALLCERCGYVLDGLSETSNCSECGKPVVESLPSARTGSSWQNHPGFVAWARTLGAIATGPKTLFRSIRPVPTWGLLAVNLGLSALIVTLGGVIFAAVSQADAPSLYAVRGAALIGLGAAAGFASLTWIEMLGVELWSRRLGRTLPAPAAWCVCAHASYGWLVSAVLAAVGLAISPRVHPWVTAKGVAWFDDRVALALLIVPGVFLGLLIFETLVYVGVRRCRYINLPRPDAESSTETAGTGAASDPA